MKTALRRLVPRPGLKEIIGLIAHRMSQLIWIILHTGVRYEERSPAVSEVQASPHSAMTRTRIGDAF
jgi:hypothetical protein